MPHYYRGPAKNNIIEYQFTVPVYLTMGIKGYFFKGGGRNSAPTPECTSACLRVYNAGTLKSFSVKKWFQFLIITENKWSRYLSSALFVCVKNHKCKKPDNDMITLLCLLQMPTELVIFVIVINCKYVL